LLAIAFGLIVLVFIIMGFIALVGMAIDGPKRQPEIDMTELVRQHYWSHIPKEEFYRRKAEYAAKHGEHDGTT
jgi:hypothetical protein